MEILKYTVVVMPLDFGRMFAVRWLKTYHERQQLELLDDRDTYYGDRDAVPTPPAERTRRTLEEFRTVVMNDFDQVLLPYGHEMDVLTRDEDQDIAELAMTVKEFTTRHPSFEVYAVVPMDLTGVFAFVIKPKDMKPISTRRGVPQWQTSAM